jgi:hypothetical protein
MTECYFVTFVAIDVIFCSYFEVSMKLFCKLEVDDSHCGSDEIHSTNLDPLDLEASFQCGSVDNVDNLQYDAQADVKTACNGRNR